MAESQIMNDPTRDRSAINAMVALIGLGKEAFPALVVGVTNKNPMVRSITSDYFSLGSHGNLEELLTHRNEAVTSAATSALRSMNAQVLERVTVQ